MACIVRTLQKFFEVVGQTNHVELAQAVVVVQACWVHVTVNDSQGVKVGDRACKLTENAKYFFGRKPIFAELFPR